MSYSENRKPNATYIELMGHSIQRPLRDLSPRDPLLTRLVQEKLLSRVRQLTATIEAVEHKVWNDEVYDPELLRVAEFARHKRGAMLGAVAALRWASGASDSIDLPFDAGDLPIMVKDSEIEKIRKDAEKNEYR